MDLGMVSRFLQIEAEAMQRRRRMPKQTIELSAEDARLLDWCIGVAMFDLKKHGASEGVERLRKLVRDQIPGVT